MFAIMFAPSLLLLLGSILLTLFPHASSAGQLIQHAPIAGRPQCTVLSSSNTTTSDDDDVPALLSAFSLCNHGGDIHFPSSQRYTIASKLNPVLHDVRIRWGGTWVLKPDIEYWRNSSNHFPIAFQNHAAAFVISGEGIMIDGEGTGGIDGNGETWYTAEEGFTRPGRPMPCVFWNGECGAVGVEGRRVGALYFLSFASAGPRPPESRCTPPPFTITPDTSPFSQKDLILLHANQLTDPLTN